MNLLNAQVTLTYELRGVQLQLGVYLFREKVQGKILPKTSQFRTISFPTYSDCRQTVQLSEKFVNHAISEDSRPNRNHHPKAYTFWKRMDPSQRLGFHIKTYVDSMGGEDYSYDILT